MGAIFVVAKMNCCLCAVLVALFAASVAIAASTVVCVQAPGKIAMHR